MQKWGEGGRKKGRQERRGFEIEETSNLVIEKLPSWAGWRRENWVEGNRRNAQ